MIISKPDHIIYHVNDKGNHKLRNTKNTMFLMFNLPARKTCPFMTKMCSKACYAKRSERYPAVLIARQDNYIASLSDTFVSDMIDIISDRLKHTKKKHIIFRIHESGDFYSAAYAQKWLAIAAHFINETRLVFVAYTKSFEFFDGLVLPGNFRLRASIWADTDPEQIKIILRNNWPIYTAVNSFTDHDSFTQCRCEDCANCAHCWDNSIPDIRCEIH